jgi:hypothetical protein
VPEDSFELSITTHVLGEQVMLAGADSPGVADRNSMRYTLRTNPILLAAVPDSVEIAGSRPGVAAVESYAITLTFSDGAAASTLWQVTIETPNGTAPGASWRATVPFSHHVASRHHEPGTSSLLPAED